MAAVAKSGTPSLASVLVPQHCQLRAVATEDIAAWDAVYLANSVNADGMPQVTRATGAAANAAAKVVGYAAEAVKSGEPVTVFWDVTVRYGASLTPGTQLFLSGTTAGGLVDAASTGGISPIGFVIDATRVYLRQAYY